MDYAIAKHYLEATSSLRFWGIVTMPVTGGDVLKKLAQREMYKGCTLNTMIPNGFNDDYSLKCSLC